MATGDQQDEERVLNVLERTEIGEYINFRSLLNCLLKINVQRVCNLTLALSMVVDIVNQSYVVKIPGSRDYSEILQKLLKLLRISHT